jgi:hypothetical protein
MGNKHHKRRFLSGNELTTIIAIKIELVEMIS